MNVINNSINEISVNDEMDFASIFCKTLIVSGTVLALNVLIFILFHFLRKFKIIDYFFKLVMNYIRSILGGFILGMSILDVINRLPYIQPLTGFSFYLMYIFPSMQFLLVLASITAWISINLLKRKINLENSTYHPISFEENNVFEIEDQSVDLGSQNFLNKTKSFFNRFHIRRLPWANKFNDNYVPKLILGVLFLHSFYSGLGFDAFRKIGIFEIIGGLHKVLEIYLINYAFEKLKPNKFTENAYKIMFIVFTLIGIFVRNLSKMGDASIHGVSNNLLFDNIFYRSLLITTILANFLPFPSSILEIGLNLISFVIFIVISEFSLMTKLLSN